mmetsp:Transcript_9416/g.21231  ORF Transcript_9416/g.21231 Transcript_9416/m.21231 type:complete len:479 (-) Transcript_9416:870-2306(-)
MGFFSSNTPTILKLQQLCLIAVLLVVSGFVEGFSSCGSTQRLSLARTQRLDKIIKTAAKKIPPTSLFDLDSIEAFESELEKSLIVEDNESGLDDEEYGVEGVAGSDLKKKTFEVSAESVGKRIDAAIAMWQPDLSRSACGNLIADGHVALVSSDGKRLELITRKAFKMEAGQLIEVCFPDQKQPTEIIPQDIPLDILYEDDHMIVINKAAHMVVHPAAGNWDGTLVNALAFYLTEKSPFGGGDFHNDKSPNGSDSGGLDETGEETYFRPGVVHRLDKGTTGVIVVSKTNEALTALSEAFAQRRVKKTYLAITVGNPGKHAVIDKPIERHPIHRQRMRVVPDPHRNSGGVDPLAPQRGRRALSIADTIAFDGKLSLVRVRIETGRTHQIRVHLQDRRTPIYGDDTYGLTDWNKRLAKTQGIERTLLHAYTLEIDHPITGERMAFRAPLPDDMRRVATAICPGGEQEHPGIFQAGELSTP